MNGLLLDTPLPLRLSVGSVAPAQLRAARGMLDWTRTELAKRTGLSAETIKNIEHGTYVPKEETIKAIIESFSRHGVQFVCFETTVSTNAEKEAVRDTITISYSGMVCISASLVDVQEASQQ